MDKRGTFIKSIFIVLLFFAMVSTISLGAYGYYFVNQQHQRIELKDGQILQLRQSEHLLKTRIEEVEEKTGFLEAENQNLMQQSQQFGTEKAAILEQVRGAITNFENYRTQAKGEIDDLRKSVESLESEKAGVLQQIEETKSLSETERAELQTQVQALNEKIDSEKKVQAQLAKQLQAREQAVIIRDSSKLHYNLGNFYFKNRQYKEAVREYRKALVYLPDDPEANFNLAFVSDQYLADRTTALDHYKKYLEVRPEDPHFHKIRRRVLDLEMDHKIYSPISLKVDDTTVRREGDVFEMSGEAKKPKKKKGFIFLGKKKEEAPPAFSLMGDKE